MWWTAKLRTPFSPKECRKALRAAVLRDEDAKEPLFRGGIATRQALKLHVLLNRRRTFDAVLTGTDAISEYPVYGLVCGRGIRLSASGCLPVSHIHANRVLYGWLGREGAVYYCVLPGFHDPFFTAGILTVWSVTVASECFSLPTELGILAFLLATQWVCGFMEKQFQGMENNELQYKLSKFLRETLDAEVIRKERR